MTRSLNDHGVEKTRAVTLTDGVGGRLACGDNALLAAPTSRVLVLDSIDISGVLSSRGARARYLSDDTRKGVVRQARFAQQSRPYLSDKTLLSDKRRRHRHAQRRGLPLSAVRRHLVDLGNGIGCQVGRRHLVSVPANGSGSGDSGSAWPRPCKGGSCSGVARGAGCGWTD